MSDTILRQNAIKCLIANFGVVQTERFISLIIKEPFDYTEWQAMPDPRNTKHGENKLLANYYSIFVKSLI